MTVLDCLKQGFNKLKQDIILLGPYLAFTLMNVLYSRQFLDIGDKISSLYIFQLIGQHVLQTLFGFFLLIMVLNLRKNEVNVPLAFSLFTSRLANYFWMSVLVNIPFSIIIYFGMTMANMESSSINTMSIILVGLGIYMMVPLTAFGYFACIRYVMSTKAMLTVFSETLLVCFKHYRMSLRWFWMMLTLNMLQIFILPLSVTNFIFKDVILAIIQAFILTLVMTFSVYYYKQFVSPFFRQSVSDTIDTASLSDTKHDQQGDGNES
tara:strand:+ start:303 stop:1097 length:795 start_codon:yes stop_codon:yes gene_type:complete